MHVKHRLFVRPVLFPNTQPIRLHLPALLLSGSHVSYQKTIIHTDIKYHVCPQTSVCT